jgi:hypothetical protein
MVRLVLGVLFCIFAVLPGSAFSGSIMLKPDSAHTAVDSISAVTVSAGDLSGVHGYSITISYDPARLRCVRAVKRPFLSGQTLFFATIDSIGGTVRIDETILGTGVQSGSGIMALVEFRGRQPGITLLSFAGADVRDAANQGISVTTSGSTLTIHGATGVTGERGMPVHYELGQNFPNPCNPSTMIPYALAASGQVSVEVLSIAGEHITTLVNEFQDAGVHVVRWDPMRSSRMIASGTYFCVMTSGDFRATTKILVIK